jgi:hypothetical protein
MPVTTASTAMSNMLPVRLTLANNNPYDVVATLEPNDAGYYTVAFRFLEAPDDPEANEDMVYWMPNDDNNQELQIEIPLNYVAYFFYGPNRTIIMQYAPVRGGPAQHVTFEGVLEPGIVRGASSTG